MIVATGRSEIPAAKQLESVVIDHGTVRIYEGGAKEVTVNGGRVEILCKSSICQQIQLNKVVINSGEMHVNADIKIAELQLMGGQLLAQS